MICGGPGTRRQLETMRRTELPPFRFGAGHADSPPGAVGPSALAVARKPRACGVGLLPGTMSRLSQALDSIGVEVRAVPTATLPSAAELAGVPHCIIVDPSLDPRTASALLDRAAGNPAQPLLCLDSRPSIAAAVDGLRRGAFSYLEDTIADTDLVDEVQQALRESARRQSAAASATLWRSLFDALSPRELQVLELTLEGLASKAIARLLQISPRTVDSHRSSILRKIGAGRLSDVILPYCLLQGELHSRQEAAGSAL